MWSVILTLVTLVITVVDAVLTVGMHSGKQWRILNAGNPVMPDGRLRYDMKKFRRSAEILLWACTVLFLLLTLSLLLVQLLHILPEVVLAVTLYVHGSATVMAIVLHLAYVDSYGQTPSDEEECL